MTPTVVRRGTAADIEEVAAILTDGFAEDAVFRYMFPTQEQYRRLAPGLFRWMAEETVESGDAFLVEGRAVLLGRRSADLETDEEWATARRRLREICADAATEALVYFDAARQHHPMGTPHWYGDALAVRPGHRDQRLGSALVLHCAERHADLPLYGDASSTRSAALYARLGFTEIGSYQLGGEVTLWSVWREPQRSLANTTD